MEAKLILILALTLSLPLVMMPQIRASNGITGDINGDGKVDILDVTLAAGQYSKEPGDSGYNATIVSKADLASPFNGVINMLDLVTLISHYTG